MVGAEYLAVAGGDGGGYYYEVEVVAAKGQLFVGVASPNLEKHCEASGGGDACSWWYSMKYGEGGHGCVGRGGPGSRARREHCRGGGCGGGG
jgi:hypothetical protein